MAKLHHEALIYAMVLASAADREMSDPELRSIGDMVRSLPIFLDLDEMEISIISGACAEMLNDEDGLEAVLDFIKDALPEKLRETAYALACDIVAADLAASQEELRLLEMLRHRLQLDRLIAAGIERGSRARHMVV
jgi:tellurite resistance protein